MHQRSDRDGIRDGPDADRATQGEPQCQHRKLYPGADSTDGMAAAGKTRHETVSRTGPEAGADVASGGRAVEHNCCRQHSRTGEQPARLRQEPQAGIDDEAYDDNVADGAEARTLPQWNPCHEDDRAHSVDDPPDLDGEMPGDALVQYVPRVQSQPRLDEQRQAHAECG